MARSLGLIAPLGALLAGTIVLGAASPTPNAADAAIRATLPNGLRIVVVPDRLAPVVTTEISYLVGSNEAPPGFPGTAHALEHMMFRGSDGLDKSQLAEIGAELGGSYNAQTSETTTQYFYTAPKDDYDVILHIEALRMHAATLAQADWDKERGAIEQEVSRDLSSPAYVYLSELQGALFAGTPYAHDALGTRPSFDRTDAALLRRFYETWYAPNNAVLVVAGDVDAAKVIADARNLFGAIPSKTIPKLPAIAPTPMAARSLTYPTNYPVAFATLAFRMPGLDDPDFATADILSDVLSSKRFALYGLVPAGRALATQFLYEPKTDVGFGVAVAAYPRGGDAAPVLADLRGVLADVVAHGVPADLVEAAKTKEIADLAFAPNDVEQLARIWSRALVQQKLESPDDIRDAYRRVTPEAVAALARRLLDPAHTVTALLVPNTTGKPIGGRGYGGAESFASPPDHPVPLPDWAKTALARLTIPPPAPGATVTRLANGLTLIVHPTDISHTVTVYGFVRMEPGLEAPPGREGIDQLADTMIDYGTTHRDRIAFREAVDGIAADLDLGRVFSLKVPKAGFAQGVALLAEGETTPALPDSDFAVARQQLAAQAAGLLQSPAWQAQNAANHAILPPGDPDLRTMTPATAAAITEADLRGFFAHAYRPELTTIDVIGDVTPSEAKDAIARGFGAWRGAGATPDVVLPPVPPSHASSAFVPDPNAVQTSVQLVETLDHGGARDPERVDLDLGDEILGGGFSSRLYRDLRIRSGDVYSVRSHLDWQRTRTIYSVEYGADAARADQARDMAMADIADIAAHGVTANELRLAKASKLRQLPLRRASVDAIASQDLTLVDLGLPLDQPDRDAQTIFNASASDVQQAMARIRAHDLAEITRGPAPTR